MPLKDKKKGSNKTTAQPSREKLARMTGRNPEDFPSNPTERMEVDQKPAAVGKGKTKKVRISEPLKKTLEDSSKKAVRNNKKPKVSEVLNSAVSTCAGALANLSEMDRAKALVKLCGMFGVTPKSAKNADKTKKPDGPKPKPVPPKAKNDFNEMFSRTFAGQILQKTSKVLKESAKTAEFVVTPQLAAIHRELLNVKGKVKLDLLENPNLSDRVISAQTGGNVTESLTDESFKDFVNQFGKVQSFFEQNHEFEKPVVSAMMGLAQCLRRNEIPNDINGEQWQMLSAYPIQEISLFEARSQEGKEDREFALRSQRESHREKLKKRKADSKRDGDISPTKTVPVAKKPKASDDEEQVLEES